MLLQDILPHVIHSGKQRNVEEYEEKGQYKMKVPGSHQGLYLSDQHVSFSGIHPILSILERYGFLVNIRHKLV
jgi:hypothetical protein